MNVNVERHQQQQQQVQLVTRPERTICTTKNTIFIIRKYVYENKKNNVVTNSCFLFRSNSIWFTTILFGGSNRLCRLMNCMEILSQKLISIKYNQNHHHQQDRFLILLVVVFFLFFLFIMLCTHINENDKYFDFDQSLCLVSISKYFNWVKLNNNKWFF